jgi:hypothetical protein
MSLQWIMALMAVLAILLGPIARFGLNMLAPSVFLTLLVIVSPPGRRSPIGLIAWFSVALLTPFTIAILTSRLLCGYWFGAESPIFFAVCAVIEGFPLLLILGVHRMP